MKHSAAYLPLIVIFFSLNVFAQSGNSEELSLDEQQMVPVEPTPEPVVEVKPEEKPEVKELKSSTSKPYKKFPIKVKSIERVFLFNGWDFGVVGYGSNFNVASELVINGSTKQDLSSKSSQLYNVGVLARYGSMALDEVGTLIDFIGAASVSNGNIGSTVYTLKADFNIGYAFEWGRFSGYPFGGAGFEVVTGNDIKNIVNAGGSEVHIGGGVELFKNTFFELIYQYTQHALSPTFINTYQQAAINLGATEANINAGTSKVSSNVVMGRILYKF